VLELASEPSGPMVVGYLKTFSVALIVALVIATNWPHLKRVSEQSLWYVLGGIGWNQSDSVTGAVPAKEATAVGVPGTLPAGGAGHCSSRPSP
jgi:hypothetical protein